MVIASKEDYANLIKQLLPPGPAFPRDDTESTIAKVIDEIAAECNALDTTVCKLFVEAMPGMAEDSFDEWLTDFGLPDECFVAFTEGDIPTEELRRELVIKASKTGGQSIQFFKDLCKMLGFDVQIRELRQNGQPDTYFKWVIDIPDANIYQEATVNMLCTDPLAYFANTLLTCMVRRYKPAHTEVFFNFV